MRTTLATTTLILTLLVATGVASADPVSATNLRPVSIGAAVGGSSVQDNLDNLFGAGVLDAGTDQSQAGYFQLAIPGSTGALPQLVVINTAQAEYGLFTLPGLDDANAIAQAALFSPGAAANTKALVNWTSYDSGLIVEVSGSTITSRTFSGIASEGFGFYVKNGAGDVFYSLDDLNGGDSARILAYEGRDTNWAFAFETAVAGFGAKDFNEAMIFVESIQPIPEPGTLALVGVALVGAAFFSRRRRNKA